MKKAGSQTTPIPVEGRKEMNSPGRDPIMGSHMIMSIKVKKRKTPSENGIKIMSPRKNKEAKPGCNPPKEKKEKGEVKGEVNEFQAR
mmetsp:Transcript_34853/g.54314  ORF Transcript_34853/g.54314 Transcript_34853/m.54314 type:complete len:87 (+) Transcript_34853:432-692(+)